MPIFNSLGSNYTLSDAWLAIQQLGIKKDQRPKLIQRLDHKFAGQTHLFYKGRDAIEFTLRSYGIGQGDQVITQAFACFAIEEGIVRTGAKPVYVDIAPQTLNPSVATLETARQSAPQAKAVLIQHTLGLPAPILAIKKWCHQHQLLLIEDLAQSIGAVDEQGQPLGTLADAIILSFGRDKIIDAVSGGAAIFKLKPTQLAQAEALVSSTLDSNIVVKDMLYPLLTWLIRQTHSLGIGKIIFQICKRTGWLTSPIASPTQQMVKLPSAYAPLIWRQLDQLASSLQDRRKKASYYAADLKLISGDLIDRAANLRVAFLIAKPDQLTKSLTKAGIYLTDRWYRQPVDCGSLNCHSEYIKGSCPNAELAAQQVVNLPTHRGINLASIEKIVQLIQQHQ